MKKNIEPYTKESLILRLLTPEDLAFTLHWRNHPAHRIWFNSIHIITEKEHKKWFNEYRLRDNDFIFIITNKDAHLIGQLSLYNVDYKNKSAIFGRLLVNPEFSNKGHMKKAILLAIKLAKEIIGLHSLSLEVKINNEKAIHLYQSCGFLQKKTNDNNNMLKMHISLLRI